MKAWLASPIWQLNILLFKREEWKYGEVVTEGHSESDFKTENKGKEREQ